MLLTLSARSVASLLTGPKATLNLFSLPKVAMQQFEFRGLNVQTRFLAGMSMPDIERLRDQADKIGCPWLALIEEDPHDPATQDAQVAEKGLERIGRVLKVAQKLGCSSVGVAINVPSDEPAFDRASERIKKYLGAAEKLDLNLLLMPAEGKPINPEQLTRLIRKVGGFRMGALPDFQAAAESGTPADYLRSLTPYASTVTAVALGFNKKGQHVGFDAAACLNAVKAVGFEGSLSLEYRRSGDPLVALEATRALYAPAEEEETE
jgi:sugar phosphate isomerase/epimerase